MSQSLECVSCHRPPLAAPMRTGGVCPQGCWPERGEGGTIICVCDYGARSRRALSGAGDVAGGVIFAGLILVGLLAFAGTRGGSRGGRTADDHRARLRQQVSFKGLLGIFGRRRRSRSRRRR